MGISAKWIIRAELTQRQEEGCDTEAIGKRIEAALEKGKGTEASEFGAI